MKIFTDNQSFLAKFLGDKAHRGHTYQKSHADKPQQTIARSIFPSASDIYELDWGDDFWEHGFYVNHSSQSQFDLLRNLISKGASLPDKLICLAGSGNGFKGFRNRSWQAVPGNLHLTFHFAPQRAIDNYFSGFLIIAAVAVTQTLGSFSGLKGKVCIKWVNDILLNKAKISGVLTYSSSKGNVVTSVLLGIGINVNSLPAVKTDIFVPEITALNIHLKNKVSLEAVYSKLLDCIRINYCLLLAGQYTELLNLYRNYSKIIGQYVQVYSDPVSGKPKLINEGVLESIGEQLELKLKDQAQMVRNGRLVIK